MIHIGAQSDREHWHRIEEHNSGKSLYAYEKVANAISKEILETLDKYDLSAALGFSQIAIDHIKSLCESLQAKIVISSSWRCKKTFAQVRSFLAIHGLAEFVIGMTPDLSGKSRGEEIEAWLKENYHLVDSFVILDDCRFDFCEKFEERFIECDKNNDLLTEHQYEQAQVVLKKALYKEYERIDLFWSALSENSARLRQVALTGKIATLTRLKYKLDRETVLNNFFSALAHNNHIQHLILHNIEISVTTLATKLQKLFECRSTPLKSIKLSLSETCDIQPLLEAFNASVSHIPEITILTNGLYQPSIASWLKYYPQKLTLKLYPLNKKAYYFGGFHLSNDVLQILKTNPNIRIHITKNFTPKELTEADLFFAQRKINNRKR